MKREKTDYKQYLELLFKSLKVEPQREYMFHPTRKWRLDFAFPDRKIAVEYEGMAFKVEKSRHTTISGFSNDCEKYNELAIAGWTLVRVNAKLIDSGIAATQIARAFMEKAAGILMIGDAQEGFHMIDAVAAAGCKASVEVRAK